MPYTSIYYLFLTFILFLLLSFILFFILLLKLKNYTINIVLSNVKASYNIIKLPYKTRRTSYNTKKVIKKLKLNFNNKNKKKFKEKNKNLIDKILLPHSFLRTTKSASFNC